MTAGTETNPESGIEMMRSTIRVPPIGVIEIGTAIETGTRRGTKGETLIASIETDNTLGTGTFGTQQPASFRLDITAGFTMTRW